MNEELKTAAEDAIGEAIETAKNAALPEEVKKAVLDGLTKSQEACQKMSNFAKDTGSNYEELLGQVQTNARQIGETLVSNTEKNSEAAFAGAKAVLECKDVQDAAKVQADFVQNQFSAFSQQMAELVDMSTKSMEKLFEAGQEAANKAADQIKNASS